MFRQRGGVAARMRRGRLASFFRVLPHRACPCPRASPSSVPFSLPLWPRTRSHAVISTVGSLSGRNLLLAKKIPRRRLVRKARGSGVMSAAGEMLRCVRGLRRNVTGTVCGVSTQGHCNDGNCSFFLFVSMSCLLMELGMECPRPPRTRCRPERRPERGGPLSRGSQAREAPRRRRRQAAAPRGPRHPR